MNNELEIIWKQAITRSRHFAGGTEEHHENLGRDSN
jgi:hypothetical protein